MVKKQRINIYIHPARYEAVKEMAKKKERSISSMIDRILLQYIVPQRGREKKT